MNCHKNGQQNTNGKHKADGVESGGRDVWCGQMTNRKRTGYQNCKQKPGKVAKNFLPPCGINLVGLN